MTCIVGVERAGKAYLACDSFLGNDSLADVVDRPKWFRLGSLLVAYAGSFRGPQVVQATIFRQRRREETPFDYLVRAFVPAVIAAYQRHNVRPSQRSEFLVALDGQIYHVQQEDGSVLRSRYGYTAIGAGAEVALGALGASQELEPKEMLRKALRLALKHTTKVREPFHYVEV